MMVGGSGVCVCGGKAEYICLDCGFLMCFDCHFASDNETMSDDQLSKNTTILTEDEKKKTVLFIQCR
eukprot:UN01076